MKNIGKKISALALSAVLACAASGCTFGPGKWSYKTDVSEISAGSWIYNTYQSYNEAMNKIQEANKDNEDFDAQLIDFKKEKIEDKVAIDWIFDDAKDKCISLLTVEKLAQDKNLVIDESQMKMTGDMYLQYYYNASDESKAFYERLGVSEDSFSESVTRYGFIYQELFEKIYGKDGEKELAKAKRLIVYSLVALASLMFLEPAIKIGMNIGQKYGWKPTNMRAISAWITGGWWFNA